MICLRPPLPLAGSSLRRPGLPLPLGPLHRHIRLSLPTFPARLAANIRHLRLSGRLQVLGHHRAVVLYTAPLAHSLPRQVPIVVQAQVPQTLTRLREFTEIVESCTLFSIDCVSTTSTLLNSSSVDSTSATTTNSVIGYMANSGPTATGAINNVNQVILQIVRLFFVVNNDIMLNSLVQANMVVNAVES